jgi:hypothetical protein
MRLMAFFGHRQWIVKFSCLKRYKVLITPASGHSMPDETLSETDFLRELQAFVSEKWKRNPCDRCGTFQWSILPGDKVLSITAHTPITITVGDRQFPFSASSYPVDFIPLYCDNCGNTVNIYFGVFDQWRKDRNRTT